MPAVFGLLALALGAGFVAPAQAQTFTLTLQPNTIPAGTDGVAYSRAITAVGGNADYSLSVTAGALPAGLSLTGSNGNYTLGGTPTASGTSSFTITATDIDGNTGYRPYTFSIGTTGAIGISPASPLTNGTQGVAYSQTLTASGGTGPYTFSHTGTLPTGMSLSSGGVLSGTPGNSGTFNFTANVTDTAGNTGSKAYQLNIGGNTLTVTPATLPNGTQGAAYTPSVGATGGSGAYTFSISAGALPTGTAMDAAGNITGTASAGGTFNFTVRALDSTGNFGTRAYTVHIGSNILTVLPASLPGGTVGTGYSQTMNASGGTLPYSFAVTAGSLPSGLSLTSGGVLSGTPTAGGTFNFDVTATDPNFNTGTRSYALVVGLAPLSIAPATLPNGTVSSAYSQNVTAGGGVGPYNYVILSGALPAGLSMSTGGAIAGTPSAAGSYTFTVQATDTQPNTGARTYTVTIGANILTVTPGTLPSGTQNTAYGQTLGASGGNGTYSFSLAAGALPAGLTLSSGGAIGGTPTGSGSSSFTVAVVDTDGNTGSGNYTIGIGTNSLTVTPGSLANGTQNTAYSQTLGASGGNGAYSFSISGGALPAGLTLSSGGIIGGTPTGSGLSNFTVAVIDTAGNTGSGSYAINIGTVSLTLTPASLPAGTQNVAYSQNVTASGGNGSYSYAISAGALPAGLTLSAAGAIAGTPTGSGISTFTVMAVDTLGNTGTRVYNVNIGTVSLTVNPATLPVTIAGKSYRQSVSATGGTAPYTFSVSGGALPPGLTLDGTTGVISGTPTGLGVAVFTIQALDINGNTGTRAYTVAGRADPALDPEVQGLIASQVAAAQRFASAQVSNVTRHLEGLHDRFDPCSFNFGLALPVEQNAAPYYGASGYAEPNQIYSPTDAYGALAQYQPQPAYGQPQAYGQPPAYGSPAGQVARRMPGQEACAADWASSMAVWTSGAFQFGSMTPSGVAQNRFTTAGLTAGVDIRVNERLIVGAAAGFGADHTDVGVNGTQSDAVSYSGTLYASLRPADLLFVDAAVGYGTLGFKNQRFVTGDGSSASGDRKGSYWFGAATASFELGRDNIKFAPYVSGEYIAASFDPYSEQGGALALSYDGMKAKSMSGAIGLRGSIDIPTERGVLTPNARVEYRETRQSAFDQLLYYSDLGSGTASTFSQAEGTSGATTVAVGIKGRTASGLTAEVEYSITKGASSLLAQAIRAALRIPF